MSVIFPFRVILIATFLFFVSTSEQQVARAQEHKSDTELRLTSEEQAWLAEHAEEGIRYCYSPYWEPYDYRENGTHQGIFSDYLNLLERKLDIKFIPVDTKTWDDALNLARQRSCDFISGAVKTDERETYLNFTAPYFNINNVLLAKPNRPFIGSVEEIIDKPIGVLRNSAVEFFLRRDFPDMHLVPSLTNTLTEMLEQGEIYAFALPMEHAIQYMNEKIYVYKIIGKLDYPYLISVAVRDDWPEFLGIMDKAISSLTQAEHNDVRRKWTTHTLIQRVDYTLLWATIIAAISIVGVFFFWNRRLQREVILREGAEREIKKKSEELEESRRLVAAERDEAVVRSITDSLTGLHNRGYLMPELERMIKLSIRHDHRLSLIILDIDNFKRINDTLGHQAGDDVLKVMGAVLKRETRSSDLTVRYGGDEFIVVLPETTLDNAEETAEKLRKAVFETDIPVLAGKNITISLGVAMLDKGDDGVDNMIARADAALYRAKEEGRNRICLASS